MVSSVTNSNSKCGGESLQIIDTDTDMATNLNESANGGGELMLGGEGGDTEEHNNNNNNNNNNNDGNNNDNNNNEAKKVKLEKPKPSKVVHIRNIPSDVTETEIVHLGIPFGRVSNVLVLKGKNQAFLELADEVAAIAMVNYFTNCVAQLRGRSVYVQFSTHKELKTDQSHSNANSAAQAALQAAQQLVTGQNILSSSSATAPVASLLGFQGKSEVSSGGSSAVSLNNSFEGGVQGGPNTVLRVIVEQMLYPVTLDVLFQIFSRIGKILRIVTFTKNGFFQALIQYPDVILAQAAKLSLDNQNIYNGCCTLRIEYSKLASLNVRYNNDKSRDYTNPSLPSGPSTPSSSSGGLPPPHFHHPSSSSSFPPHLSSSNSSSVSSSSSHTLNTAGVSPFVPNSLAQQVAAAVHQQHGGHPHHGHGHSHLRVSANSMAAAAAVAAAANLQGNLGPQMMHHHPAAHQFHPAHHHLNLQQQQQQVNAAGGMLAAAAAAAAAGGISPGCVLLCSNLNEDQISPEALFTLFGVYGDVQRVKILFNKKDSALIQMREPSQAQLAMTYLDRLKLYNKVIRVTISKHFNVQMPKDGQPDAGLTKDFSNSPLHRFKKPDSKNFSNIYAPSATLHLSNIPPSVQDDEIVKAFENCFGSSSSSPMTEGVDNPLSEDNNNSSSAETDLLNNNSNNSPKGYNVKGFKFFPKDRKMALLQLGSIEEASEALIKMHNFQLRENSHLRVSFSKSTI